jgi:putative restriction endonuclease
MASRLWDREETLAAFNLYCRLPFGRLHARNPEIIKLATALGRTPGAVAMKCCNLAAFDPALRARGIRGLSKASAADREIWDAFHANSEAIGFESESAIARILNQPPRVAETVEWEDIEGLDRTAVTKVRVNQHLFRAIIFAGYRSQCAVCTMPIPALLVASHIVPWAVDKSLRMNPTNGICLCAMHDRAFDRGVMSVTANYEVAVTAQAEDHARNAAVDSFLLAYVGRKIALPDRWHPDPELLSRHALACRA